MKIRNCIYQKNLEVIYGDFQTNFSTEWKKANTKVILVAGNGEWSQGYDKKQDLERLPENYTGGIWTNRIDIIAPVLKK